MTFEWDNQKNEINIKKHGIHFSEILPVFEGRLVERIDERKDYGETRFQAIGKYNGYLFFIVYTIRGSRRRIISARLANQAEREIYHEQIKD